MTDQHAHKWPPSIERRLEWAKKAHLASSAYANEVWVSRHDLRQAVRAHLRQPTADTAATLARLVGL